MPALNNELQCNLANMWDKINPSLYTLAKEKLNNSISSNDAPKGNTVASDQVMQIQYSLNPTSCKVTCKESTCHKMSTVT